MRKLIFSFLLLFVVCSKIYSQIGAPIFKEDEFSGFIYQNYTDRQGYTWISTDQGVYRWDTKNLEHFTIADGLPSNEVFTVYQDSKYRVWMAFYNGDLCYYYKGKIYNKENDERLRNIPKIRSQSFIEVNDTLYFHVRYPTQAFSNSVRPTIVSFDSDFALYIVNYVTSNMFFSLNNRIYSHIGHGLIDVKKGIVQDIEPRSFQNPNVVNDSLPFSYHNKYSKYSVMVNQEKINLYALPQNSLFLGNFSNTSLILKDSILYSIEDNKFTILNNLYKKYSFHSLHTSPLYLKRNENLFSTTIDKLEIIQKLDESKNIHELLVYDSMIWSIKNDFTLNKVNSKTKIQFRNSDRKESIYNSLLLKNSMMIVTASQVVEVNINRRSVIKVFSFKERDYSMSNSFDSFDFVNFKSLLFLDKRKFLVSLTFGIYLLTKNRPIHRVDSNIALNMFIDGKKRLWLSRANGIFYTKDFDPKVKNLKKLNIGKDASIQANDFKEDKYGNILIATNAGVIVFREDNTIFKIDDKHGLTSNDCKKVEVDKDGTLWIATNKGVNHIEYLKGEKLTVKPINYFLKSDGILSNNIKDFLIKGDSIYIASDKGLNLIVNKNWKVDSTSKIWVHINRLFVNGEKLDSTSFPILSHTDNTLQIDFSAIYYERTDRMKVFYNLISNGDTTKQELKDRTILLQSLSPNDYKLQIYAYDQDYPYIKSNIKELSFEIEPPFYKTWWFILLITGLVIGGISSILYSNFRRRNEQLEFENASLEMERNLSRFKLEALKAEMNPHFIFNCLNSIKDYILKSDIENSQYYLSQLSRLIRIALYNTKTEFISLGEEVEFIKLYVELEQLRFNHNFDFIIDISNDDLHNAEVPTMILQPFFENAIRHGKIGQLEDRKGKLLFRVYEENGYIIFLVKDNGIGIKKAAELKKKSHSKHKSMALDIIKERVEIYNHSYGLDVKLHIEEIEDDEYKTQVKVQYVLD